MSAVRWSMIGSALGAAVVLGAPVEQMSPRLPEVLDEYVTGTVRLEADEREELLSGAPVAKLLEGDASREVGVFGAVWIDAPRSRYIEALRNIESFERGAAFPVTRRISAPPRPGDFADMHLPERDLRDLRKCHVGDCEVKLDEPTIEAIRTSVDWKQPGAHAVVQRLFRQFAFNYVTGYLEGGNDRLAVYRDRSRPVHVSAELETIIERVPPISSGVPEMRRYLLDTVRGRPQQATDFLYWQETVFGLKPTIRISHVTILDRTVDTVIAAKMLYATHYFWTGLEFRVLIPDPARGSGFWFVTVNRSRSDGLSGFLGLFVRGKVRGRVKDGLLSVLRSTKAKLEGQVSTG